MILNYRHLAANKTNKEGKQIKEDTLVRCAYPNNPDEKQLADILNVDAILDFRSTREIAEEPSLKIEGVETLNYQLGGNFQDEEDEEIAKSKFVPIDIVEFYKELPYTEEIKRLFKDLTADKQTFLFHCTAGKDRTGVMGILMMYILDFNEADIKEEYLTIDPKLIAELKGKLSAYGLDENSPIADLLTVKEEYYDAFVQSIVAKYGSIEEYLEKYLGIDTEARNKFKEYYLN